MYQIWQEKTTLSQKNHYIERRNLICSPERLQGSTRGHAEALCVLDDAPGRAVHVLHLPAAAGVDLAEEVRDAPASSSGARCCRNPALAEGPDILVERAAPVGNAMALCHVRQHSHTVSTKMFEDSLHGFRTQSITQLRARIDR